MIAVIDYGMGNLLSVFNGLQMVGADARICTAPQDLADAERIILPGVGAFPDCAKNLKTTGFWDALNHEVLEKKKPILGICLGMQVMAKRGSEVQPCEGLGWFDAEVVRMTPADAVLRVPQIGWNDVSFREGSPLFKGLKCPTDFYFVHSFFMKCANPEDVDATCDYGGAVTAAVRRDNIFATQFHPEKSQDYGLRVLENFLSWMP